MASFAIPIANAVRNIIAGLPNAPAIVEVRKLDTTHPREISATFIAVIVTIADEREEMAVSGAGTATDQGDVLKSYEIAVSIYGTNFGNVSTDMSSHPDFVLACKQALNKKSLTGVPSVYGTKLLENSAWERVGFKIGNEVSHFGLLFYNAETRLGN